MAIVNKPAGIVLYRAQGGRGGGTKNAGHGRDTLLSALPHVLTPSNISESLMEEGHMPLKRPHAVHRLDRPTSGLVVIAKTKYAAVQLARQFEFRLAKKSYMAIVNGFPVMPKGDRDESNSSGSQPDRWNTIDYDLEEKNAVTEWRVVTTVKSLQATDGVLTLVEMRPKTGRYHQLRRHFVSIDCIILFTDHIYISCHNNITSPFSQAWVCNTPLVGDSTYDNGGSKALRLRQRGLFLCSNGIEIQHPYYNSPSGLEKWDDSMESDVLYRDKEHGCIMVNARIDLPDKFESFLFHENKRAEKFLDRTT
jgi:23S rRNA-/tRNA-specific pseudouridylate synthase